MLQNQQLAQEVYINGLITGLFQIIGIILILVLTFKFINKMSKSSDKDLAVISILIILLISVPSEIALILGLKDSINKFSSPNIYLQKIK